ncbi:hypothetical protein [Aeromonas finlandensis]|uniref:hypothetical protein n=1 Tax=Aeromonas finlandensis TaxID=1543375 RepID=UPI0012DFF699|nr:hypothetical protein [Aeromonas finlandensis]
MANNKYILSLLLSSTAFTSFLVSAGVSNDCPAGVLQGSLCQQFFIGGKVTAQTEVTGPTSVTLSRKGNYIEGETSDFIFKTNENDIKSFAIEWAGYIMLSGIVGLSNMTQNGNLEKCTYSSAVPAGFPLNFYYSYNGGGYTGPVKRAVGNKDIMKVTVNEGAPTPFKLKFQSVASFADTGLDKLRPGDRYGCNYTLVIKPLTS